MTLQQILTALQGLPNIGNVIAGAILVPGLVTLGVVFWLIYRFVFKGGSD